MRDCRSIRSQFSEYLDGAVSGTAMHAIASHLELLDESAELCGHLRQLQRRLHRFMCARRCALCRLGDSHDVLRDLGRAFGGFGDVSRHFVGRRALFLDRRRDRAGNVA